MTWETRWGQPRRRQAQACWSAQADVPTEMRNASPTVTGCIGNGVFWKAAGPVQSLLCGGTRETACTISRPCDDAMVTSVAAALSKGSEATMLSVRWIRFGGYIVWRDPVSAGLRTGRWQLRLTSFAGRTDR